MCHVITLPAFGADLRDVGLPIGLGLCTSTRTILEYKILVLVLVLTSRAYIQIHAAA